MEEINKLIQSTTYNYKGEYAGERISNNASCKFIRHTKVGGPNIYDRINNISRDYIHQDLVHVTFAFSNRLILINQTVARKLPLKHLV